MPSFIPGQRWISETEPELGLGVVIEAAANRVTILYLAAQERRTYARDNAPLSRVLYAVGDTITHAEGWKLKITQVAEREGLVTYQGLESESQAERAFPELELSHFIQFNRPRNRLFAGQFDPPSWYSLRLETLEHVGHLEQSPVKGLCGARTSLIPHQLYIAHEVAGRVAPRVLLADEVGLGKTIEAGLILHQQLLTGRAERVLILVPEALSHQWLVEMRRRFNLRFSLFDESRCLEETVDNPFAQEQLVLCALELFVDFPEVQQNCLDATWDLCVVDEAHHLQWAEDEVSEAYAFVEQLAQRAPGLLLLTATPEQLGRVSHFARLRLLDPHRFANYDAFVAEEDTYQPLMAVIDSLLSNDLLNGEQLSVLKAALIHDKADGLIAAVNDPEARSLTRREIIDLLLDRHGTGRVFFRNTRATVTGFPERQVHGYPLTPGSHYAAFLNGLNDLDERVCPESRYRKAPTAGDSWWKIDPRVFWLGEKLRELRTEKVLIICHLAKTASELEEVFRVQYGIKVAAFTEYMSIVNRDRAAAWFVETEDGAQALLCSEIGSEGRNFQFAQHLVLFDLPLSPDLLEQRIGRLDRIGQRATIQIHVPYFPDTASAVLFDWYHAGLNAFRETCPIGQAVLRELEADRNDALANPGDLSRRHALIERTRECAARLSGLLQAGRDRLLELHSCRREIAADLVSKVQECDRQDALWPYLERVFDSYGVNVEEHSHECHVLSIGEHLREPFPELVDEGVTVTLSREIALAREDVLFLTWEHPMVRGGMDMIMSSGHGNVAVVTANLPEFSSGTLLLEVVSVLESTAPRRLQIGRCLPPTVIRNLIDSDLHDRAMELSADLLDHFGRQLDRETAVELVRTHRESIERMLNSAETISAKAISPIVAEAAKSMLDSASHELKRLAVLKRVNPNVRQSELDQLKQDALDAHGYIQHATLRLDAIRLVIIA